MNIAKCAGYDDKECNSCRRKLIEPDLCWQGWMTKPDKIKGKKCINYLRTKMNRKLKELLEGKSVYISGAMNGNEDYEKQFEEARCRLSVYGARIIIPSELGKILKGYYQTNIYDIPNYSDYLLFDLAFIADTDVLFILKGYENSLGCMAEISFAKACKKTILYGKNYYGF